MVFNVRAYSFIRVIGVEIWLIWPWVECRSYLEGYSSIWFIEFLTFVIHFNQDIFAMWRLVFAFVIHYTSCKWIKISGRELFSPLTYSMSKSNMANRACHLAKICLEVKFLTSFSKISLAVLQSIRSKNFWFNSSSLNFKI